jgi:hypothetical protein
MLTAECHIQAPYADCHYAECQEATDWPSEAGYSQQNSLAYCCSFPDSPGWLVISHDDSGGGNGAQHRRHQQQDGQQVGLHRRQQLQDGSRAHQEM